MKIKQIALFIGMTTIIFLISSSCGIEYEPYNYINDISADEVNIVGRFIGPKLIKIVCKYGIDENSLDYNTEGIITSTFDPGPNKKLISNYEISLTGLSSNTSYYAKIYATSSAAATEKEVFTFSFTTLNLPDSSFAIVTTTPFNATGLTTASGGGEVTSTGGSSITERGICYATTSEPSISNTKVIDPLITVGVFTSNITGLISNTTYHVRAYATNSMGTSYGADTFFTTLP